MTPSSASAVRRSPAGSASALPSPAPSSATEDEIQKAIQRARSGRTTLLITHRLSQIRWADVILVMHKGTVVAQGTHDVLLHHSDLYRRIFARYDITLPPLERAGG